MKHRRASSPEQLRQREERKARFAEVAKKVADMTDDERTALAARLPVCVTCEGHPLSLRNTLLIALQRAEPASIVGGFRQWIKQGRCVRKGEHGVSILFPRTPSANPNESDGSAAEETAAASAANGKKRIHFLTGTVFDVAQTDELNEENRQAAAYVANPRATSAALFVPPPITDRTDAADRIATDPNRDEPAPVRTIIFDRPPPGGWTEADKVHKTPTPQIPSLAGMSPLGMTPPAEKIADAREVTPAREGELFSQSLLPPTKAERVNDLIALRRADAWQEPPAAPAPRFELLPDPPQLPTEPARVITAARPCAHLSDTELLCELTRSQDAAARLLAEFSTLNAISRCSFDELTRINGIGERTARTILAAFHLGPRVAQERFQNQKLDSPELVNELLGPELRQLHKESLRVILLDTRYRVIRHEEVSRGSVNESIAHPRDVFRPAVIASAYAVIVVHNHPSGDPSPSQSDHSLTRRLAEAAELLQIKLLDHIIIGQPAEGRMPYFSFKEAGVL